MSGQRLHDQRLVVLLSAGAARDDARLRARIAALTGLGLRVSVLSPATPGDAGGGEIDGAPVRAVPVPVRAGRGGRVRGLLGYPSREQAEAARLTLAVAQADLAVGVGRARDPGTGGGPGAAVPVARRGLRRARLRARRRWIWLREGLLNRRLRRAGHPLAGGSLRLSVGPARHWERLLPGLVDLEAALGPVLDELAPDAVHVLDVDVLGVGVRAAARARRAGRRVPVLYDVASDLAAEPGQPAGEALGRLDHEAAYLADADRVLAADEPTAVSLRRRHRLPAAPSVLGADATQVLAAAYRDLLGALPESGRSGASRPGALRPLRLAIGPSNTAGQGWSWGRAAARAVTGLEVETLAVLEPTSRRFPADRYVDRDEWTTADWQAEQRRHLAEFSHVLCESGRGMLGGRRHVPAGGTAAADVPELRAMGLVVGLVFHGSEVRSPARHRELEPHSAFRYAPPEFVARIEGIVERNLATVAELDVPVFVSTPDLIDHVPGARWLPVVVDTTRFTPGPPILHRQRPVVLHAPTNPTLKGSAVIDAVLGALAEAGRIDYRRIEMVPPERMVELVRESDIVVDQLGMALYGVQAVEALAAGRLVVSHVGQRIRSRLPEELPIVEVTPLTLAAELDRLLAEPDRARQIAAGGPGFAERVHGGGPSGEVLAGFLLR